MHVSALSLTDFRSWSQLDVELAPGPTALIGSNGQGKTNVVEALLYVATLGSHRVSSDAPLVRQGAERAIVRAQVQRDDRTLLLELELNPGKANRARVNRSPVPRAREVLGLLRTVLFAPEDLDLVKGDPSDRRGFLDDLLVLRTPRLAAVRADYERVLKQRNALLKTAFLAKRSGGADMRTLDVWDSHLAQTGAELLAARLTLVDELLPYAQVAYREVSKGQGELGMAYKSSLGEALPETADREVLAAVLLSELARIRPQEVDRGVSLVGPHRDELVLSLGTLPVKGYASHGESWSVALALRLASYELLRSDGGEPVLVLDDVFAELDTGRRERLASLVEGAGQVLVTAAVPGDVPEQLVGGRYDVHDGVVTRVR
ncbi:MAG TPA: DNA replication/repair protein RecF [Mycobacteriales bacterium]|nr:DNA replication/repair protein RecF [Mycobacteriales bacterium]